MPSRVLLAIAAVLVAAAPVVTTPAAAGDAGWYHLSFEEPVTQASRDAVVAAGGEAVAPLGADTYVAWFEREPAVAGASVIARAAEDVFDGRVGGSPQLRLVALAHESAVDGLTLRIADLGLLAEVRQDAAAAELQALYLTTDLAGARQLAAEAGVLHVGPAPTGFAPEDERSSQIVAGNVFPPRAGYEDWLAEAGVTGEGVNVTVVDSGVDPRHPDLAPAIVGKVERSQLPTGEPADSGGHGTHVAGAVAGRALGLSEQGQERPTDDGFLMGLGVAPGAGIIDQNILGNTAAGPLCNVFWPPSEWEPLAADALAAGSHIWNASWQSCEGIGAGYIHSASEMDRLTRDGDSAIEGPQPFTMVFSAGNSGAGQNDADTRLTAPKEAKNTIVVASLDVANPEQISSFSSRGPAVDGRWVPTVAAPGGGVLSTRSTTSTASCSTPYTGGGAHAGLYATCSGTSMAAPHVAGSVALITEWWRNANDGADPSPAMAKALLVNSAVDMGQADIPNRHEGWGRVDLSGLFLSDADRVFVDQSVLLTDPGQTHEFTVDVGFGDDLRTTLVWTDAPGVAGADPALVNDLDLVLVAPGGTVYRGNQFSGGGSVAGGEADRINNVENVFLADPEPGTWIVQVAAHALPGDGDPFAGDDTDQDFALVVSH